MQIWEPQLEDPVVDTQVSIGSKWRSRDRVHFKNMTWNNRVEQRKKIAMASDKLIVMASNLLRNGLQPISDVLQPTSDGLQPNGNGLHPSNDLQPTGDGLQPTSDCLQPNRDGLQPTSDGLQPTSMEYTCWIKDLVE